MTEVQIIQLFGVLHIFSGIILFSSGFASSPTVESDSLFALWVSYLEIYNECVYDLLQPAKKRLSLRVCDDGAGNAYVKGAGKLFKTGQM